VGPAQKSVSTQGIGKGPSLNGLGGGNTQSVQTVLPISALTTAQAIAADNAVLHRSTPGGDITLPYGNGLTWLNAAAIELPESEIAGVMLLTKIGTSWWHGLQTLFTGMPQVTYGVFTNTETGQSFTIYAGDSITVTDHDGYSAQVTWNPLGPSPHWLYVPGSLKDPKGNSVPNAADNLPPGPAPAPGGTHQPGGAVVVALPGGPSQSIIPVYNDPTPGGKVIVDPCPYGCQEPSPPPPTAGCSNLGCEAPT
jgi:hypothetical protein